jgi:hypothetical protein
MLIGLGKIVFVGQELSTNSVVPFLSTISQCVDASDEQISVQFYNNLCLFYDPLIYYRRLCFEDSQSVRNRLCFFAY